MIFFHFSDKNFLFSFIFFYFITPSSVKALVVFFLYLAFGCFELLDEIDLLGRSVVSIL